MLEALKINMSDLPEDGLQVDGVMDGAVYGLKKGQGAENTGLMFDLYLQRFDTELLIQGVISTTFTLECVRTLHPFDKKISLDKMSLSVEIEEDVVDLTELLREEILILLPVYPTCDMGDKEMSCEIEEKYLALDTYTKDGVEDEPAQPKDDRWAALDDLDNL